MAKKQPRTSNTQSLAEMPHESVDTLLQTLRHPLHATIDAVRAAILAADPAIREEVKWNSPSFYTSVHFATLHLRQTDSVLVVFHLGATKKAPASRLDIADPEHLLTWRSNERAIASFASAAEVDAKREALQAIVRQWLTCV